jgi:hypothetical protein
MSGTSMGTPMQVALAACLADQWQHMTGRMPTEPEAVTLCLSHTRDISIAGRDVVSGVGEIDACPLAQRRRITVETEATSIQVETSGRGPVQRTDVALQVPARIEPPGHFVTQFRPMAESAGALVEFDPERNVGTATIDVVEL